MSNLNDDIDYLFSKINWGASFLDAKAIEIMNTLKARIETDKSKLQAVANEVTKVWTEDGEVDGKGGGDIQMRTPIAWHRVIRKVDEL
jgi:hypothetical protein